MLKKVFLLALVVGSYALLPGTEASAQVCTGGGTGNIVCTNETNTMGSTELGFDPTVSLMDAVSNTDASAGPCFTCVNSNAGGTTAGALTASMFGVIRLNSDADLGDKAFNPVVQGMTIPTATSCNTVGCNDSGDFVFSLPVPTQDFLSEGTPIATTVPPSTSPVGRAGVLIDFSNTFTYSATDSTISFDQAVSQTTFTEGLNGDELQVVTIAASSVGQQSSSVANGGGTINWEQSIVEGGFALGPLQGSFDYNNTTALAFDSTFGASTPTGPGQSAGQDPDLQRIPQ